KGLNQIDRENISGNVSSYDLLQCANYATTDVHSSHTSLIMDVAMKLRLPQDCINVVSPKLLTAATDHGEQITHWDNGEAYLSAGRYSFIGYCSAGAMSTAVPRLRKRYFHVGVDANGDPLETDLQRLYTSINDPTL